VASHVADEVVGNVMKSTISMMRADGMPLSEIGESRSSAIAGHLRRGSFRRRSHLQV
jgi:hypothetical protein